MIDSDLLQSNYIGRDGFRWWIGQVADPTTSKWGNAKDSNAEQQLPKDFDDTSKMYLRRCKVRILGYHTMSDSQGYVLKDSDLPWAHIMVPAGQGTGVHGVGELHEYRGGENVMGFFLDGDEAQQPVIIGGFGNQPPNKKNKKAKPSEITNEKGCEIKPFQPRISTTEGFPKHLHILKSEQKFSKSDNVETTNALTGKPENDDSDTQESDPSVMEHVGSGSRDSDGGHKGNKRQERSISVTRNIDDASRDFTNIVQASLKSIFETLEAIQEYKDVYLGGAIRSVKSLNRQIDGYFKTISGAVRAFFNSVKGFLLDGIEEGINAIVGLLPETGKPILFLGITFSVEQIMCIIENVLNEFGIFKTVKDIFNNFISGRFIDSALCAAEAFITQILNTFFGPILERISGTLGFLAEILGSVENLIDGAVEKAFGILGFIDKIFSFFDCGNDQSKFIGPSLQTWSLAGPSKAKKEKFNSIIAGINLPEITLPDVDPNTPDVPLICDAYNGYIFPPILEFSYGDASGSVVVRNGGVVGVYIDEPGRGYSPLFPPAISIIQPGVWGKGGGAKATAVVDPETGGISRVIVRRSGRNYVSSPILAAQSVSAPQILNAEDEIPRDKISNVENVIPFLEDLHVVDTGVGYSPNDTILINNNDITDYGFETSIEIGPEGSILEININNTNNFPITFDDRPIVEIVSDTGSGANIVPIMNFILVRDFSDGDTPDQIVTATDTDGNQISVKSGEILKVVQCYNQ